MAADYPPIPVYTPPPALAPPPVTNPGSCYVGGTGGLWVTQATVKPDMQPGLQYPYGTNTEEARLLIGQPGVSIGLRGGCDTTYGDLVVGFVGDFDFTPTQSKAITGYADPWLMEVRLRNQFQGSLGLRAGMNIADTLFYVKAGVSASPFLYQMRYSAFTLQNNAHVVGVVTTDYRPNDFVSIHATDKTRLLYGPALGLGAERQLTPNWSLSTEVSASFYLAKSSNFDFTNNYVHGGVNQSWTIPSPNLWGYSASAYVANLKVGLNRHF